MQRLVLDFPQMLALLTLAKSLGPSFHKNGTAKNTNDQRPGKLRVLLGHRVDYSFFDGGIRCTDWSNRLTVESLRAILGRLYKLIQTDGLPLYSFYEYKSGIIGKPQSCGVASTGARNHATVESCIDFLTARRLPLVKRIFAPPIFHEYDGTFVYVPSIKECEEAEEQDVIMHTLSILGFGTEGDKVQNGHGATWGIDGVVKFIRA
ncbi:hypothetical protein niasHT_035729 [Heterodera trifolii]|uniref:Uncharacterized protein n=1 Tax=Heterodera trifolii TaxID=157864 RepID=A0ABD2IJ92_9BILA